MCEIYFFLSNIKTFQSWLLILSDVGCHRLPLLSITHHLHSQRECSSTCMWERMSIWSYGSTLLIIRYNYLLWCWVHPKWTGIPMKIYVKMLFIMLLLIKISSKCYCSWKFNGFGHRWNSKAGEATSLYLKTSGLSGLVWNAWRVDDNKTFELLNF